jgi:pyrimidine-nucleoside phosphorylase
MIPQWIIEKKRDGGALTDEEIGLFVGGYNSGSIADYQMSALLMAIAIRGMSIDEIYSLTKWMLFSGQVLDTSSINKPKIDKHSTGGIGDKITLVLAPLAASCGIAMPMVVGRGLGITGGTLDKLESIPGYNPHLADADFLRVVQECGCSIVGASSSMAPADKKIYALRDVTGTVESIPLIAASILSKKLSVGLDGLVFDVKWGRGAFMKDKDSAVALARTLVEVCRRFKLRSKALLTDMNQPLGRAVGNAMEVLEAVETLRGGGPADVIALTLTLGEKLILMGGKARAADYAREALLKKIKSGEAFERFKEMVKLHGGQAELLDNPGRFVHARVEQKLTAKAAGYVQAVDAELIGKAALVLGAGRARVDDRIDYSAGIICLKKTGERVKSGEPLAMLYADTDEKIAAAEPMVGKAYATGSKRVKPPPLVAGEM